MLQIQQYGAPDAEHRQYVKNEPVPIIGDQISQKMTWELGLILTNARFEEYFAARTAFIAMRARLIGMRTALSAVSATLISMRLTLFATSITFIAMSAASIAMSTMLIAARKALSAVSTRPLLLRKRHIHAE